MIVEIFELKGYKNDELDSLIIKLSASGNKITKIDILDAEKMKNHEDVIRLARSKGENALPIIKVDGKIVAKKFLESKSNDF